MRSQYHGLVLLLGIMLVLGGCPPGSDDDTAGDDDTGDDDDNQADDDTAAADGTWMDPSTGLIWQVEWAMPYLDWQGAIDYCEDLTLGGSSDWRLPSIDELRSLIRGCPALETGGSCGVHGGCLTLSCHNDDCHYGCNANQGPGPAGLYHPVELGFWEGWIWSSSAVEDVEAEAWVIFFLPIDLWNNPKDSMSEFHCVR